MELTPPPSPPAAPGARPAIDRTRLSLAASEFVPEVTDKDLVVLHVTAGTTARSAFDTCDGPAFSTYKGVCSHANFREDKWDIGPAFPWDRLAL